MIKVLLLLWHPKDTIAGGFIRVQEFLPFFAELDITIIDNEKSVATGLIGKGKLIEYQTPVWIQNIYKVNFVLGRFFEWSYALITLIKLGSVELHKGSYDIIYGPTGDNLHIFLAGIILKKKYPKVKLLLDVLNLAMPEGSFKNNFMSAYKNGVGLFRSTINSVAMVMLLSIEKSLIKYCDFVVTVSPYMKKIIADYYPLKKIDYTPSGVTLSKFVKRRNNHDSIQGVYVGRHTPEKGIFDLVKMWHLVCKKDKKAQLNLIGFCDPVIKAKLVEEIKRNHLEKNITLFGVVSSSEKAKQLQSADLFFHLAYYEPLVPVITILEAFAYGLPVIMYDVPSLEDYPSLRKEKAFFIVKNKDKKHAAEIVLQYVNNNNTEKKKLALEARKLAKKYSWGKIAEKELSIMKALVKV
ncbi:MAG: glycosyltransferase family 4 protein [Candidatus Levyibacteriota bacterium]